MFASPFGPHVIVLGNQKGGSGKSTLAMHIAIALIKAGQRVTTIDLDYEQRTLTRYMENRRISAKAERYPLQVPDHYCIDDLRDSDVRWRDPDRIDALSALMRTFDQACDFILIDTPGAAGTLNLFAHGLADTLITPINDSFVDLDVIFSMGPTPETMLKPSRYADTVQKAFDARRRTLNPRQPDWIVVRNRMSPLTSRNERGVVDALETLEREGVFRSASGLVERVVYREFFPLGLTMFDSFETSQLGIKPSISHVLARLEVRQLITALALPLSSESPATADPANHDQAGPSPVSGDLRQLSIADNEPGDHKTLDSEPLDNEPLDNEPADHEPADQKRADHEPAAKEANNEPA
jgi:chromosome partitioning protein